jgi:hypothetical protein
MAKYVSVPDLPIRMLRCGGRNPHPQPLHHHVRSLTPVKAISWQRGANTMFLMFIIYENRTEWVTFWKNIL